MDAAARARAERYLAGLDEAAPGLVTGLHVVGSAVLDDYRAGSDLDVVVELAGPAPAAVAAPALAALVAAHAADPGLEAVYVRAGELDGPVAAVADGPHGAEGTVTTGERSFQLNPVTWEQLRVHAGTVRGTRPTPVVSRAEVAAFCVANLGDYWWPELTRVRGRVADRADDAPAPSPVVEWYVLGPARLWHTVRTGEIVSKSHAGALAAARWPDVADAVSDVLAARTGSGLPLTTRHVRAALTLGERISLDL